MIGQERRDRTPGSGCYGPVTHGAAGSLLCAALILFSLALSVAGDASGTPQQLWHRYFETDAANRRPHGAVDIPPDTLGRCEATRELFLDIGGSEPAVEGPDGKEGCSGNVIAVIPGPVPDAIIISAHLDRAGLGEGALDDFSGVVMLGQLYAYFAERYHRHTLIFAAFCGEETGQAGSRRFIAESPRMPAVITAVINLECLGFTTPHAWAEGSSDRLEEILTGIGEKRGIDCGPVSILNVSADSIPFLEAGYLAITIAGIGPDQVRLLGTAWDRPSVVREDVFETTFAVLADFIDALDGLKIVPNPKSVPSVNGRASD